MRSPNDTDTYPPAEVERRSDDLLKHMIGRPPQPHTRPQDKQEDDVTVFLMPPASGQFVGRLSKQPLTIRSEGISVVNSRAEWLRSQGLSDGDYPGLDYFG